MRILHGSVHRVTSVKNILRPERLCYFSCVLGSARAHVLATLIVIRKIVLNQNQKKITRPFSKNRNVAKSQRQLEVKNAQTAWSVILACIWLFESIGQVFYTNHRKKLKEKRKLHLTSTETSSKSLISLNPYNCWCEYHHSPWMFRVINTLQISSGIHRSQARTWNTTSWHQELYNRANNGLFWAKPRLHCHQGSILTLWLHWCGIFGRKNSLKTPLFVLTSSVSRFNWFRFVKSNANYKIYRLNLSLEICFLFIASLMISLYSPTAEKQRPKGKFLLFA